MSLRSLALAVTLTAASVNCVIAQESVETFIARISAPSDDGAIVDVRILNPGTDKVTTALPETVEGRILLPGAFGPGRTILLRRDAATAAEFEIGADGFVTARFRLSANDFEPGGMLSVPQWGGQAITLVAAAPAPATLPAVRPTQTNAATPPTPSRAPAAQPVTVTGSTVATPSPSVPPPGDRSVGNAFLENLGAHEPIYATYGPGSDAEARLQFSLRYRIFGSRARQDGRLLSDGLYLAYTQRMFWDLRGDSSPFRNIDFQPEIFYLSPALALSDTATVSAQFGLRHESNGQDGEDSRSFNTLYVAPMAAFSIGEDWRLTLAPRAWIYVGDKSDNPDIADYRGNLGLFAEIGEEDGWRLSSTTRVNFETGKGSISADVSYPLRQIWSNAPDLYLYAQGFAGYGENLLDYDRHMTRFRFGLALVR